jgi:hypothetical protein
MRPFLVTPCVQHALPFLVIIVAKTMSGRHAAPQLIYISVRNLYKFFFYSFTIIN